MRLNPIVDLSGDFVFESLTLHSLLVDKEFLNEYLSEALLDLVISFPDCWRVLAVVDLRAAWLSAVLPRRLVSMPHIQSEHELVGDLVEEGDVGAELGITRLELIGQLDLDELVEFFGPLPPIRSTVEQAHQHEHGDGALSLV